MSNLRIATLALVLMTLLTAGCATAAASEIDAPVATAEDGFVQLAQLTPSLVVDGSAPGASMTEDGDLATTTQPDGIQVSLTAPYTTTSWDQRDPAQVKFELPLLYLRTGREATAKTAVTAVTASQARTARKARKAEKV